jgi:hypothetical protein
MHGEETCGLELLRKRMVIQCLRMTLSQTGTRQGPGLSAPLFEHKMKPRPRPASTHGYFTM